MSNTAISSLLAMALIAASCGGVIKNTVTRVHRGHGRFENNGQSRSKRYPVMVGDSAAVIAEWNRTVTTRQVLRRIARPWKAMK